MKEKSKSIESHTESPSVLTRILNTISNHYGLIITASTLIFSTACLIYSEAFFNEFSIDFYSFGSFSDIYKTPMSQDIETAIILISGLAFSIAMLLREHYTEFAMKVGPLRISGSTVYHFLLFSFICICILLAPYTIQKAAQNKAKDIKEGYSARYEIIAHEKSLKCKSIIGSTADYIFVFDYADLKTKIIPRPEISQITLIINNAPEKRLRPSRYHIPTELEKLELAKLQTEWSKQMKLLCGETISWPTF